MINQPALQVKKVFNIKWNKLFFSKCRVCFKSIRKRIYCFCRLISLKNSHKLKGWSLKRFHFLFFSNIGEKISLNIRVLGFISWNLISTMKRWPILSSCEILSKILLNSTKRGGCLCFCLFLIPLLKPFLLVFCHLCQNQTKHFHSFY